MRAGSRSVLVVAVILLALAFSMAAGAGNPVLVAPKEGFFPPFFPTLAASDDGFAVAWAWRDFTESGWRFARFDLAGNRIGDDIDIGPEPQALRWSSLLDVDDGFLLFTRTESLRLDALGQPQGPPVPVTSSGLFMGFDVARSSRGILLTFVEFSGNFWYNQAQRVSDEGAPVGPDHRIGTKSLIHGEPFSIVLDVQSSPVAPRANGGFVTAWIEEMVGVKLRELARDGRPQGDVQQLVPAECRLEGRSVALAVAEDGTQLVVYSAGCEQGDLHLIRRSRGGLVGEPVQLTEDPLHEGGFDLNIRLALHGDRLGVLYPVDPLFPNPFGRTWRLAEFDLEGRPVGEPRSVNAELGATDFAPGRGFFFDARTQRYVTVWQGDGPEGPGAYYGLLEPAP